MNVAKVLESGLTGAATLTLLQETLDQLDPKAPNSKLLHKRGIIRHLKHATERKGMKAVKGYVKVAAELLGILGYYGLSGLGKRKNAVLRGGVLGAIAGAAVAFTQNNENEETPDADVWRKRIVTVALYILGGLIAGKTAEYIKKKKKKK
ncbi:MAG: hypothetical protein ACTHLE_04655 [Agriterribacter sp.]